MNIRKIEDHSQTTKLHFKLYKAGKLWLVGAIASGALVAGLSVSTTANAATNEDDDNLAEVADSGTITPKSVKLATSTADPASSAADPVHSVASPASSTADPVHSVANPASSTADPAHSVASPASSAADPAHSVASLASPTADPAHSGANSTLSAAEPASDLHTNSLLKMLAPVAEDTPVVKTGKDINGTPVTGTLVTKQPALANFYVSLGGSKYVPYNSMALVGLVPYDTENFADDDFPESVYGFYVILPVSISATLKHVQDGADAYVKKLQADVNPTNGVPYVNVLSLTVSQLSNTSDGRQVFYFKPNAEAQFTGKDGIRGFSSQIHMETLVSTAPSTNPQTYTSLTVNNPSGTSIELATTDVLYMGIGDQNYADTKGGYMSLNAVNLFGPNAADWPDTNLVGIWKNNGADVNANYGKLDYVAIQVKSNYQVSLVANPSKTIYSGTLYTGAPGTQINPAELMSTTVDKKYTSRYWRPQYMGTDPNNPVAQARPTTALLEPTKIDLTSVSDTTPVPGQTYYFYTNYIQTKLDSSDKTFYAGNKNSWDPADTLKGLAPDGSPLTVDQAIAGNTPDLGKIIMTIKDSAGKVITQADLQKAIQKPGTYTVTYEYDDAQDNNNHYVSGSQIISTIATSTITVKPAASTLTVADQSITAGTKWTPTDAITGQTAVDGTRIATPAMGTAADGSTLTVTIMDSDNNTLDPVTFDASTPGTYTLTYTYTDANGNIVTPDPVTLTVNAPTIPDSGSNTSTGNTNTNNPTTDPGSTGTGTTTPSKPTTPAKPILKTVHAPQVTPVPKHPGEHPMAMGTAPAKGVQTTGGHAMTTSANAEQSANSATLPQTSEQNTPWLAELGLVLLALSQTLVIRRKQD